jgi:hypothetical protein
MVLKAGDLALHPAKCKIAGIALPQTGQDHHMVRLQTVLVPWDESRFPAKQCNDLPWTIAGVNRMAGRTLDSGVMVSMT